MYIYIVHCAQVASLAVAFLSGRWQTLCVGNVNYIRPHLYSIRAIAITIIMACIRSYSCNVVRPQRDRYVIIYIILFTDLSMYNALYLVPRVCNKEGGRV